MSCYFEISKQYSQLPWHVFAHIYSEENPVVYPNFTNRTVYNYTYNKVKGCNGHSIGVTQWWWLVLFSWRLLSQMNAVNRKIDFLSGHHVALAHNNKHVTRFMNLKNTHF